MDDLMLLMLFSYPGVITDLVYTSLAKEKTFYRDASEFFRVARAFFLSALTAFITMLVTLPGSWEAHTIANWIETLKTNAIVWRFAFNAACVSSALGFIWFGLACLGLRLRNHRAKKNKKAYHDTAFGCTWHDVIRQPDQVDLRKAVIEVCNGDGERINCGFPFALPNDIRTEPSLALSCCEWVDEELDKAEKSSKDAKIDGLLVAYSDLEHGYTIKVWSAPRLWKEYLDAQAKQEG